MAKAKVVINEQHSLMEDQYRALREQGFSEIEFVKIPKDGLTKEEQMKLAEELKEEKSIGPHGYCVTTLYPRLTSALYSRSSIQLSVRAR